ncbi:MAG: hypothetical protein ABSB89_02110 [Candidatus Bathyarchaeia archaeon]|jgi:hypothetical protein
MNTPTFRDDHETIFVDGYTNHGWHIYVTDNMVPGDASPSAARVSELGGWAVFIPNPHAYSSEYQPDDGTRWLKIATFKQRNDADSFAETLNVEREAAEYLLAQAARRLEEKNQSVNVRNLLSELEKDADDENELSWDVLIRWQENDALPYGITLNEVAERGRASS